ncbi:MAG TPA: SUF system NifU family Fe-S cluster assembly protein [Chloroflexota bacterium]
MRGRSGDGRSIAGDSLYREVILSHYRNPTYRQTVDNANVFASAHNPLCGDELDLTARIDQGRVAEAGFEARACSIVHASADIMAGLILGKSPDEVFELAERFEEMMSGDDPELGPQLGELTALREVRRYPVRVRCALLPWSTIKTALQSPGAPETA